MDRIEPGCMLSMQFDVYSLQPGFVRLVHCVTVTILDVQPDFATTSGRCKGKSKLCVLSRKAHKPRCLRNLTTLSSFQAVAARVRWMFVFVQQFGKLVHASSYKTCKMYLNELYRLQSILHVKFSCPDIIDTWCRPLLSFTSEHAWCILCE